MSVKELFEKIKFEEEIFFVLQARRHVFKSGPAEVSVKGGEYERGYTPSRKGDRGISPEKIFDL